MLLSVFLIFLGKPWHETKQALDLAITRVQSIVYKIHNRCINEPNKTYLPLDRTIKPNRKACPRLTLIIHDVQKARWGRHDDLQRARLTVKVGHSQRVEEISGTRIRLLGSMEQNQGDSWNQVHFQPNIINYNYVSGELIGWNIVAQWIRPWTLKQKILSSNPLEAVVPLGKEFYPHCQVPQRGLKTIGPLIIYL